MPKLGSNSRPFAATVALVAVAGIFGAAVYRLILRETTREHLLLLPFNGGFWLVGFGALNFLLGKHRGEEIRDARVDRSSHMYLAASTLIAGLCLMVANVGALLILRIWIDLTPDS